MGRLLREVEIGLWYETADSLQRFEVVAMDDVYHTIEIQHFDGTLEEIEYESWSQLEAQDSAPPDDDSGALDTEPPEHDVTDMMMSGWEEPLPDIDQIGVGDTLY